MKQLINLFYPKSCSGCETLLTDNEITICSKCRHEIPLTQHHLCKENEAFKKFYGRIPVEFVSAMMYYHKRGIVQEMIHKLKYKGHEEIGKLIGNWYSYELSNIPEIKTIDAIIPVPLHKKKHRERGYNQVDSFGKALSKELNIPYLENVLIRKEYSKTQTFKNLISRTDINNNIFCLKNENELKNKHILLIDDVITTGSTLEACGRALLKSEGCKISIVCMAMSHN